MVRAERDIHGGSNGAEKPGGLGEIRHFEDPVVESWAKAKQEIIEYPKGDVATPGGSYTYKEGRRLLIAGKQVMDTCEYPWAEKTINEAFARFREVKVPIRVLELGFGMGITAERVIQQLVGRGEGEYQAVELNRAVYDYANDKWKKRWMDTFAGSKEITPESDPRIRIVVRDGEAGEEARKLLERGEKFRLIISDTYPLRDEDRGVNDLLYVDVLKRLLTKDGVFAFYPYLPGAKEDELTGRQYKLVNKHFEKTEVSTAEVSPPPSYRYLFRKSGPVRKLPVAISTGPIL